MHEILFRGKRTDNGEWVEGYYSNLGGNSPRILKENIFIGKRGRVLEFENIKVLPETVGQFTGLTDKNGRKIFEGDILKSTIKIIDCDDEEFSISHYYKEDIGIVEWREGGFMKAHKSRTCASSFFGRGNYVIGNIHDNPELLEGGRDNA